MSLKLNQIINKLLLAAILTTCVLIVQQMAFHEQPPSQNPDPEAKFESQRALISYKVQKTNDEASAIASTPRRHMKQNASLTYKDLRQPEHLDNQPDVTGLLKKLVTLLGPQGRQVVLKDLMETVESDGRLNNNTTKLAARLLAMNQASASKSGTHGRSQDKTNINAPNSPQPTIRTTAPGKIPKILHLTFASVMVPKNYQSLIENCLRLNPDWKLYLWTDSDVDVLMARHFPGMLKTVKLFKHKLEKADALRYVVLYVFGGIYIDMDVECKKPFFPSLSKLRAFLDQEHPIHSNLLYGRTFTAMNSAMGAEAKHPLFKRTIEKVVSQKDFGDPVTTTGPLMLTHILEEYRKSPEFNEHPIELLPHYIMSPEPDRLQNFRNICTHKKHNDAGKKKIKEHKARQLSVEEEACLSLESLNWKLAVENHPETIAVHKFMHLGYPDIVARLRIDIGKFDASEKFKSRIHFYSKEKPLNTEELLNVLTNTVM